MKKGGGEPKRRGEDRDKNREKEKKKKKKCMHNEIMCQGSLAELGAHPKNATCGPTCATTKIVAHPKSLYEYKAPTCVPKK